MAVTTARVACATLAALATLTTAVAAAATVATAVTTGLGAVTGNVADLAALKRLRISMSCIAGQVEDTATYLVALR
jgi:hypothetical protein